MPAVVALVLLTGCGARSSDEATVVFVATSFHASLESSDGAAACALLTDQATHEIEKSSSSPCEEGVLDEQLEDPGAAARAEVFGEEARVEFSADTVFLTHGSEGWRVAAAGCEPSPREPYDCTIQGA